MIQGYFTARRARPPGFTSVLQKSIRIDTRILTLTEYVCMILHQFWGKYSIFDMVDVDNKHIYIICTCSYFCSRRVDRYGPDYLSVFSVRKMRPLQENRTKCTRTISDANKTFMDPKPRAPSDRAGSFVCTYIRHKLTNPASRFFVQLCTTNAT